MEYCMHSAQVSWPIPCSGAGMKTPTFKPGLSYLTGTFFRASCFNPPIPYIHLAELPNIVTEGTRNQEPSRSHRYVTLTVKLCSKCLGPVARTNKVDPVFISRDTGQVTLPATLKVLMFPALNLGLSDA